MISKKVGDCDKGMNDKHADYPPSFCFIGNPSIYDCINNHPYFKGENKYSNYNDNWQPYTQVQYMVSIHTCIVIAARAAGPAPSPRRRAGQRLCCCRRCPAAAGSPPAPPAPRRSLPFKCQTPRLLRPPRLHLSSRHLSIWHESGTRPRRRRETRLGNWPCTPLTWSSYGAAHRNRTDGPIHYEGDGG